MRTILSVVCGSVAFFITAACLLADGAGALPAGFFVLTGQAGLPSYLKCDQGTRGGTDGLHNGQIKTVDTALFKKDFTLDVIFQTDDVEKRDAGEVGIGEFGHEGPGGRRRIARTEYFARSEAGDDQVQAIEN